MYTVKLFENSLISYREKPGILGCTIERDSRKMKGISKQNRTWIIISVYKRVLMQNVYMQARAILDFKSRSPQERYLEVE